MPFVLTHVEEYVKNLYAQIEVKEPQQLDYKLISERLKLPVFLWADKSQALFYHGKSYIVLQDSISSAQRWQEFTHELGHVLLHTGDQCKLPSSFVKYQEEKANQFMYHAAVPTFMLHQLGLYGSTYQNVRCVMETFNVEEDFARKRLEQYLLKKQEFLFWNSLSEQQYLY